MTWETVPLGLPVVKRKIKIDFPKATLEPDPPPFTCDICLQTRPYYQVLHRNKKSVCTRHHRPRHAMGTFPSWMDDIQIASIKTVIQEIQDECAARK